MTITNPTTTRIPMEKNYSIFETIPGIGESTLYKASKGMYKVATNLNDPDYNTISAAFAVQLNAHIESGNTTSDDLTPVFFQRIKESTNNEFYNPELEYATYIGNSKKYDRYSLLLKTIEQTKRLMQ